MSRVKGYAITSIDVCRLIVEFARRGLAILDERDRLRSKNDEQAATIAWLRKVHRESVDAADMRRLHNEKALAVSMTTNSKQAAQLVELTAENKQLADALKVAERELMIRANDLHQVWWFVPGQKHSMPVKFWEN